MMDLNEKEAADIDQFVSEKSLISPVITAQNLCSINSCPDQQMYRARLLFLFQLDSYVQDEHGETDQAALEALIDLVHTAILFTADNQLPYAKSIVFLTIFIVVIQQSIIDPFYEPERLFKRYERFLLIHSVDRPPFSSAIFDLQDLKIINEFFAFSVFRNLKLIINCLTAKPKLQFKTLGDVLITVPQIPPLAEMEIEAISPAPHEDSEADQTTKIEQTQTTDEKPAIESTRQVPAKVDNIDLVAERQTSIVNEPEEKGPEVPIDLIGNSLAMLHEKFISDFVEKEKLLIGKIKEIDIKMGVKTPLSGKRPAQSKTIKK